MKNYLLAVLIFAVGAASGFHFDRWLRRPIVIALHAQRTPAKHEQTPTAFESMNEAATKALAYSYHVSHYYEVGGVIVQVGDKFAIGKPCSDVSGDSLSCMDLDPARYTGSIVATYHTHPCNSNTHIPAVFSPTDTHSDRAYGKVGYVADLCTGKVSKYDPATDKLPDDGIFAGLQVGQFPVDGVVLDEHLGEVF